MSTRMENGAMTASRYRELMAAIDKDNKRRADAARQAGRGSFLQAGAPGPRRFRWDQGKGVYVAEVKRRPPGERTSEWLPDGTYPNMAAIAAEYGV